MSDISWELTDISVAHYGLELRVPTRRAFDKLYKKYNLSDSGELKDLMSVSYGNDYRKAFSLAYMTVRDTTKCGKGDQGFVDFCYEYSGDTIKWGLHNALAGIEQTPISGERTVVRSKDTDTKEALYLVVGNDLSMFIPYFMIDPDEVGISVTGNEYGIGTYHSDTGKYTVTLSVSNPAYEEVLEETIELDNPLGENDHIKFFTNDYITAFMHPGSIIVKVLDPPPYADGEPQYADISCRYCNFGHNEPEGYIRTGERDYIYSNGQDTHAETIVYISNYDTISVPTELGGGPLTIIGNTTFMNKGLKAVKISNGVVRIE